MATEADCLIDRQYLKEHYIEVYLEDAVAQLLMCRQEAKKPETSTAPIKIPQIKPCRFFKEYFAGLRHGNHVLFREFAFASATPYNRLSVMTSLLEAYRNHLFKEDRHNVKDYHSMLQLVWPDFPMLVIQDAFDAYEGDDKKNETGLKFLDFVKALKRSFCTGELDYESNVLNTVLDDKLNELSEIFSQGGDVPKTLFEAEYLVNVRDPKKPQPLSFTHKILDGSEFKRLLNFNDTNSVSSDEPEPISGSSESKTSVTRGRKKGRSKKSATQTRSATQTKTTAGSSVNKSSSQTKSLTLQRSNTLTKATARNKSASHNKSTSSIKSASESSSVSLCQEKIKGKLSGKHLSTSLNVILPSGKTDIEEKQSKHRSRSRSVTADQRSQSKQSWRSHSRSSASSLSL